MIEIEDSILLYDPVKSKIDPDDYLACLPYAGNKGMKKSELVGLVDYIKEILDEGQGDLLDFLDQEETDVFELHFDDARYAQIVAAYKGPDQMISYPSY